MKSSDLVLTLFFAGVLVFGIGSLIDTVRGNQHDTAMAATRAPRPSSKLVGTTPEGCKVYVGNDDVIWMAIVCINASGQIATGIAR